MINGMRQLVVFFFHLRTEYWLFQFDRNTNKTQHFLVVIFFQAKMLLCAHKHSVKEPQAKTWANQKMPKSMELRFAT